MSRADSQKTEEKLRKRSRQLKKEITERKKAEEVINTMYEIDRNILSNITSENILKTIKRMAGKLLQCEVEAVMLVDKNKQGIIRIASFGTLPSSVGTFFPFQDTSNTEVIKTGRSQYIRNLENIKDILPFEERLLQDGIMSIMRIPLTMGNEIIGTLNFGARRASAFTREDFLAASKIASQISVVLANAKLTTDLEELSLGTIKSLSNAIDARSRWTAGHSARVAKYAVAIGRQIGLGGKILSQLEVAALLHDIGKIATDTDILDKKEKLTEEERTQIRHHAVKGVEILSPIKQLKDSIAIVKHHHECFDGTGYPDGLKQEEIPFLARILSVADAVDAMSSDRPYRKSMSKEEIIKELKRCSGSQFDPSVVRAFLYVQGILS
ncbi:MAG: HD domain-containing protein [Deltaproteobacteria bacterium]|nr:HD domain-containing protein [Deltaproteobacteria bacterium]